MRHRLWSVPFGDVATGAVRGAAHLVCVEDSKPPRPRYLNGDNPFPFARTPPAPVAKLM
ncbi:MAG: hypothetical protein Gyms2KO_02860 [Gymnodinialimonas sp.]